MHKYKYKYAKQYYSSQLFILSTSLIERMYSLISVEERKERSKLLIRSMREPMLELSACNKWRRTRISSIVSLMKNIAISRRLFCYLRVWQIYQWSIYISIWYPVSGVLGFLPCQNKKQTIMNTHPGTTVCVCVYVFICAYQYDVCSPFKL